MTVVITMAGRGQRFRDAGYEVPKWAVEVHGRSTFAWSLLSLDSWLRAGVDVVLVARVEDDARPFVEAECAQLGVSRVTVIEVEGTTDGQATTVVRAQDHVVVDDPLLVYNIDTHVRPHALDASKVRGDGWIPCFPGVGNAWSFALADEDGRVSAVREKERISDDATIGLYWFSSFALYVETYEAAVASGSGLAKGERYIAPLYNDLIASGRPVYLDRLPSEAVVPLGTPADVERFGALPSANVPWDILGRKGLSP